VQVAPLQRLADRREQRVPHRAVGDDEGTRGSGEVGEQVVGPDQHVGPDHHVVGPPPDADGHALQRSSSTMASATSPGVPLPSTTWAANSRYNRSRSASRRSRSPSDRISGRSAAGRTRSSRTARGTSRYTHVPVFRNAIRFAGSSTTPPPQATTDGS